MALFSILGVDKLLVYGDIFNIKFVPIPGIYYKTVFFNPIFSPLKRCHSDEGGNYKSQTQFESQRKRRIQ